MRKKYIEYLRVFSMFAVIAIHVCITAMNTFGNGSIFAKTLYLSIRNIFHFAVPVFFMISGALLLSPNKEMPIIKLIKSYVAKYAGVIIVFGSAFALMEHVFTTKTINITTIFSAFSNMLNGRSWDHMWYMYALLGVTLFIPVMRVIVQNFNRPERCYILTILAIFLSFLPFMKECFSFSIAVSFPISSVYCMYMLMGYWIDAEEFHMKQGVSKMIVVILSFVIISLSAIQARTGISTEMFTAYSSPIIALFSGAIFQIAKNCDSILVSKETPKIIRELGRVSFGVYIIHMFWINIIYKLLNINPFSSNCIIGFLGVFLVVSVLSVCSAWILKKIPLIKWLV